MTSPRSAKNVIGYFSCAIAVIKYALDNTDPNKEQEIKLEYIRMLGAARRDYNAIPDKEKEKICFASELENELFHLLIEDKACLEAAYETQKYRADTLQHALDCVHNSVSYRLGRGMTWLPRIVRGGIQCYRDHGFSHTFRRTLYHMGLWEDEDVPKGLPKAATIWQTHTQHCTGRKKGEYTSEKNKARKGILCFIL